MWCSPRYTHQPCWGVIGSCRSKSPLYPATQLPRGRYNNTTSTDRAAQVRQLPEPPCHMERIQHLRLSRLSYAVLGTGCSRYLPIKVRSVDRFWGNHILHVGTPRCTLRNRDRLSIWPQHMCVNPVLLKRQSLSRKTGPH